MSYPRFPRTWSIKRADCWLIETMGWCKPHPDIKWPFYPLNGQEYRTVDRKDAFAYRLGRHSTSWMQSYKDKMKGYPI